MQKAEIKQEADVIVVAGTLDFSNVMDLYAQSLAMLEKSNKLSFDFSQVQSGGSAALALILEWMKYAKKNNKSIQIKQLSPELTSLARVAGVDQLLN